MPASRPNRLISEKSPYLQQHAYNPVDWHPWGPEALARARTENKPILLSIGYSTCHWCHVMAHESFSDKTIAALMNQYFICIKVDREEGPDLDKIYITAVSAMNGSAGWPLNVFLTPECYPFYGGTYFPPRAHPGAPAWPEVLQTIADHWTHPERQARLLSSGQNITATLQEHLAWKTGERTLDKQLPRMALQRLRSAYDHENGGFSPAPKFPSPSLLQFLLAQSRMTGDPAPDTASPTARHMIAHTLDAMARGGIFDHLGGGFHRYATDAGWQVPHFEKMLYDNGQLLSLTLQAYRTTGSKAYADIARRIADYVLRDLRHPDGGFFAAEDADSRPPGTPTTAEKKEGAYFTWRLAEIESILGKDSAIFSRHFGLGPEGNAVHDPQHEFDGLSILLQVHTLAQTAEYFQQRPENIAALLDRAATKLLAARDRRPRPHRDEKILTAWNGLTISGLAQAYQDLGDDRYLQAARRGAGFILDHLYDAARQTLYRSWCDSERQIPGMADDYVFLAQAFLDLYESDFQHHWLKKALQFTEAAVELFYDAGTGGFFLTRPDHDPDLILRVKEDTDSVIPSASAVAALNLLRLARLTGREAFQRMADMTIDGGLTRMGAHPEAAPYMLLARLYQQTPWIQVAIAGQWDHPETRAMIHTARPGRTGGRVVAWIGDEAHRRQLGGDIPFVERARPLQEKPVAYVCINRSCRDPITSAEALHAALDAATVN
ncbi:MAG: thioredoxin domain-containing protein [Desulfosarcina sp.]|nr:thioredoxin domain-containing protein [Desulfobacterales bacterium]